MMTHWLEWTRTGFRRRFEWTDTTAPVVLGIAESEQDTWGRVGTGGATR